MRFTFKCEGEQVEIDDVATGPATKQANDRLNVNDRPAGVWMETNPNEFEWAPHRQ